MLLGRVMGKSIDACPYRRPGLLSTWPAESDFTAESSRKKFKYPSNVYKDHSLAHAISVTRQIATHTRRTTSPHPGRMRRKPVSMEASTPLDSRKTRIKSLAWPFRVRVPENTVDRSCYAGLVNLPKDRAPSPGHGGRCSNKTFVDALQRSLDSNIDCQ